MNKLIREDEINMSFINQINTYLSEAIHHIKGKHFSEEEWFHSVDTDNERILFGKRSDIQFTLHTMGYNVLNIYAGYNTSNEVNEDVVTIIRDSLVEQDLSFFLIHKDGTSATGETAQQTKKLYDYAMTHLRREQSLRVPYYSILPASFYKGGIYISQDLKNKPLTFEPEDMSLLRAFIQQDKHDETAMIQQEKKMTDWILDHASDSDLLPSGGSITTYISNHETFFLSFSFRKYLKDKQIMYRFEYSLKNEYDHHTLEDEELEIVFEQAEAVIKGHVEEHYPLGHSKESVVTSELKKQIHTFYSSMSDDELKNKLTKAGFTITQHEQPGHIILEENENN